MPFEDPKFELAISRVAEEVRFDLTAHDVVLRGLCERCGSLERLGSLSSSGS